MNIRFSDIGELLPVPSSVKGAYQENYSKIYNAAVSSFQPKKSFKMAVTETLNLMLFFLMDEGSIPFDWDMCNLLESNPDVPEDKVSDKLKDLYLDIDDIEWDIDETTSENPVSKDLEVTSRSSYINQTLPTEDDADVDETTIDDSTPTPKEDLFITLPKYPRIRDIDDSYPQIHSSLPDIPRRQSEISTTTKIENISNSDLVNLYPNRFIQTRASIMYKPYDGITLDPDYGLLIPVEGYTDAQVRDCIIRYPHIFKLKRIVDGEFRNFYSEIEIDGELLPILEIWDYLIESNKMPITSMESKEVQIEFIKEYAIRRYLLERDISGIEHKYPIHGDLGEFITLFMPFDSYAKEGYDDAHALARTCLENRHKYMVSRNPRVNSDPSVLTINDCPFDAYCTATVCDRSCPTWTQFSYLMKRNNLKIDNQVFQIKDSTLKQFIEIYQDAGGSTLSVVTKRDTNSIANVFTYIGICRLWNGSAMRTDIYNLRLSKYLDMIQDSFNRGKSEELEYMSIWAREAKVLIISGMDYVNFKDFQSQTLLQLLQDREDSNLTTILVLPKFEHLSGQGKLFSLMLKKMKRNSISIS